MTKQQQRASALKAYRAIVEPASKAYDAIKDPAWEDYAAKLDEIEAQPDEVADIITFKGREYKLIENEES